MEKYEAVHVLWDYMQLHLQPGPADAIIAFGSYNEDTARRAARLYLAGFAPILLMSGGLGRNTSSLWPGECEAERYARSAEAEGVPREAMLLENRSSNSGENLLFCRELLQKNNISVQKVLAVHKPYMERRLAAAFPVYWPEAQVTVVSTGQSFEDYVSGVGRWHRTEDDTIQMLVGDFARIHAYAKLGYQIPQQIPEKAWHAFRCLTDLGYDEQVPDFMKNDGLCHRIQR